MGEEDGKKPEEKKPEEAKEQVNKAEKVPEAGAKEEKKAEPAAEEQAPPPPPPPPPQEIVLKIFMHCEGCARKVRRSLKGYDGVEAVITDCKTSKVVVKGEKAAADPLKVVERVEKKTHRQVQLISPIPKPPVEEEAKKPEEKEVVKAEEKKEEVPITVVLGVFMHCEACAQEIKKRIQRMKGVESAEPDLKSSQVIVKGVFEPEQLVEHVYKRTSKHADIIKVEPEKKVEEEKPKEEKEEKKAEEGEKEAKKVEEVKENKEGGDAPAPADGGEPPAKPEAEGDDNKMELKKNEFYYYHPQNYQIYPPHYPPQRFVQDMYAYPPAPQMFSDENPNACSVM